MTDKDDMVLVDRTVLVNIIRIAAANDKLVWDEYSVLDVLADAIEARERNTIGPDDWDTEQH